MYIYVYMYICVYVYMYMCTYVYMYIWIYVYMGVDCEIAKTHMDECMELLFGLCF